MRATPPRAQARSRGDGPEQVGAAPPQHHLDPLPQPGQVVQARHRQWLVERLYVLNAKRAQEEERLGLHAEKGAKKTRNRAGRKRKKAPDSGEQGELF